MMTSSCESTRSWPPARHRQDASRPPPYLPPAPLDQPLDGSDRCTLRHRPGGKRAGSGGLTARTATSAGPPSPPLSSCRLVRSAVRSRPAPLSPCPRRSPAFRPRRRAEPVDWHGQLPVPQAETTTARHPVGRGPRPDRGSRSDRGSRRSRALLRPVSQEVRPSVDTRAKISHARQQYHATIER